MTERDLLEAELLALAEKRLANRPHAYWALARVLRGSGGLLEREHLHLELTGNPLLMHTDMLPPGTRRAVLLRAIDRFASRHPAPRIDTLVEPLPSEISSKSTKHRTGGEALSFAVMLKGKSDGKSDKGSDGSPKISDSLASIHPKRSFRLHPIDGAWRKALARAEDHTSWVSVWDALVRLASTEPRPTPLLGYSEGEGVKFISDRADQGVKFFTREAARKRHGREMTSGRERTRPDKNG